MVTGRHTLIILAAGWVAGGCRDGACPEGAKWCAEELPALGGDAGTPDDAELPEVERTGGAGLLLRGVVLSPTGVLDPGEVLVGDDGLIVCVASDCGGEPAAADATVIDTHGVISPGLVDAHNHLAYNFLHEWVPDPPRTFPNRYVWADDPQYEDHIRPYSAHRSSNSHHCPAAKWGELRSLVHATTTIQGQSARRACTNGLVRNADHDHGLGYDHMRTYIGSPRDINDELAGDLVEDFQAADEPVTRYAVHMAEGYTDDHVLEEFDSFDGQDPRENRHRGTSLLEDGAALLIHCVPLDDTQLERVLETGSAVVWSPSSNLALYGRTAPIQRLLQLGVLTALGPDWTPSGADDQLAEMRFALDYGRDEGIPELTPERIWRMATEAAADAVGLGASIGRLQAGWHADVAVFAHRGGDPYEAVIGSREADVRLVLIDGEGLYGDASLQAATAVNELCEPFDACGTAKFVCPRETDQPSDDRKHQTVADVRAELVAILQGDGYPEDEQYGRGMELLDLVACD